jgi:ATP diphosphatase
VKPSRDIDRLIEIMAALRTPGSGCPWDLEQNFATIAPYTIEEAYEVADAIARGDLTELRDELGDLLLQVAFHARLAEEQGAFDFGGVVDAITSKMIRRHPHVFGPKALGPKVLADAEGNTAAAVKGLWEEIKAQEKAEKQNGGEAASPAGAPSSAPISALDGVPVALPALTRALKLQEKAGRVGFDWNDPRAVLAKIREEADEIEAELDALDKGLASKAHAAAEVGDLLFAVVNLARHLSADPEAILRATNLKFERRFQSIERALLAQGKRPKDATLAEMDALWDAAKAEEKS